MPIEIRELVIKVTIEEATKKKDMDVLDKIARLKTEIINQCNAMLMAKLNNAYDR